MSNRRRWEEAVAEALGLVRSRGLQFVDPSDVPAVKRRDGLSVAAGVAAEWYGLPKTVQERSGMTAEDWVAVAGPVESDPEWLRVGAGEWLGYVLGDAPEGLVRLSRLRPDLVALVPESVWLLEDRHGEHLVSMYLRYGGAAGVVPEPVWARYVSWVVGERGTISDKAESLARLSSDRPDLVAQVPESVWRRKDRYGESLLSRYLRAGGAATAVPESVLRAIEPLVPKDKSNRMSGIGK